MAQHSNYAQDRDLMMEAYASVEGKVPATSTTAMPRMLNEAHCDEEHEGAEETVKVELELELDKETAKKLRDQLMDEVVEEEPAEDELPAEDSSCMSHEDAEGHHPSGSDDGECDECDGYGCDVCYGTGEQDEEEIVAESYTAQYLK